MTPVHDAADEQSRTAAVDAAVEAVARGECIVLPTDTVYGIGADAFDASAVQRLLAAKGRGREAPPPVLIPSRMAVDGLAMNVPSYAKRLMDEFWPGALTIVVRSQPSLAWDLGDTNGTVALRIPDDEIALAILHRTGPLAVSSANQHGQPSATTVTEAGFALGPAVAEYLDGGPRTGGAPSTIVDCTKPDPVVLRHGAIPDARLREVLGGVELIDGAAPKRVEEPTPDPEAASVDEPREQVQVHDASDAAPSMPTLGAHWDHETNPDSGN